MKNPVPAHEPGGPESIGGLLKTDPPLMLVGGQAVNLWALHYYDRTKDLAPFVSRDIDLLGDKETLAKVARLAKARPQYFPLRPPSNEVGVVVARDAYGQPLLIEVLRNLHGVSEKELSEPAYTFEIGESKVLVPGPVALLKAKIANVADIDQAGRQDLRHVRILYRVLPNYWQEMCEAARTGKIKERSLIRCLEATLKIIQSRKGKKVLQEAGLPSRGLFAGLYPTSMPKVAAFVEKRLGHLTEIL
jgi:hypothetical protein